MKSSETLMFRLVKVFRPCRNTNGHLGGMALRMMGWRSCCKLDRLSAPRLTKQHSSPCLTALYLTVFAVLKFCPLSGLSSWKGSRSLLNRRIWRLLWVDSQKDLRLPDQKNRLQQKPVYKSGGIKTKPQKCPDHITIRHGTFLSVHESASLSFLLDPVVQF